MGSNGKSVPLFEMTLSANEGGFVNAKTVKTADPDFDWALQEGEGKLAVDVAEVGNDIIIVSTMSGALLDKIQIIINNDLLTIRGVRSSPLAKSVGEINYLHSECYWGRFSRTIVLPVHVKSELARAEYQNGVLTISMPKQAVGAVIPIVLVDD